MGKTEPGCENSALFCWLRSCERGSELGCWAWGLYASSFSFSCFLPTLTPKFSSRFPLAAHVCCEHVCQVCRTSLSGGVFWFFFLLVLQNLPCPSKHVNRLILKKACDSFVFQVSAVVFWCVCCFCCSGRNTPILDRSDLQGF